MSVRSIQTFVPKCQHVWGIRTHEGFTFEVCFVPKCGAIRHPRIYTSPERETAREKIPDFMHAKYF